MKRQGRDPLALTLLVASIALAGLWWLERHQGRGLERANVDAQNFSRDHLSADCEAFAAEHGGRTLVVECEGTEVAQMENALRPVDVRAFEEVVLIGEGTSLRCRVGSAIECEPTQTAY